MNGTKSSQQTVKPRWLEAQSMHPANKRLSKQNNQTETQYHAILNTVKTQFMPFHSETAFERDYKTHADPDGIGMHIFVTKTFYWYLACGACSDFTISFAFKNCPFEQEVRALFSTFPSNYYLNESRIHPDLTTTFKRFARVEDSSFFTTSW